jgi:hypothetical protein
MISAIWAIEEKRDAWIANMMHDREETTACQYAMETSLQNMAKFGKKGGRSGAAEDS